MRIATAGAFAVGFACGMLTLSVAVGWRGGTGTPNASAVAVPVRIPGPPVSVPEKPAPAAALPLTPELPSEAQPLPVQPPPVAEADRTAPEPSAPLHLRMPLDEVRTNQLVDSFHDKRDGRIHEALDIPAPRGTPVRAVAEGNVVKLFNSKQGGTTVYQFDNTQTYSFYYAHLDRYAPGLKEGTLLRAGDVLGYVGTTGNAAPNVPHLHFAVFRLGPEKRWWEGTAIDPVPLLRGGSAGPQAPR